VNERVALIVSASLHAAILLWSVVTFSINPLEAGQVESLPVDIISDADFTKITAGVKTAPKVVSPKPLVEKIDKAKPVDEVTPKVTEKQEIKTASAMPVPIPEVKPPPPKPPEKAKAEPKPEPDPIAEALKKEEKKRKAEEKKRQEEKRKEEAKKLKEERRKQQVFDPNRIAALLDKRKPQRQAAVGATLNNTASLGLPTGRSATLTQTEIDALRAQIQACWNPPAGAVDAKELIVKVRLQLRQDGTLSADPMLMNRGSHPIFRIAAESAMRAIRRCQPYHLPLSKYEVWRDVEVTFDPRDMFRG
jgi:outer membrane biosynthesis protein TonB